MCVQTRDRKKTNPSFSTTTTTTKIIDEGERDQKVFWAALGGEVEVKPAEEVAAEPEYVKKLYR